MDVVEDVDLRQCSIQSPKILTLSDIGVEEGSSIDHDASVNLSWSVYARQIGVFIRHIHDAPFVVYGVT